MIDECWPSAFIVLLCTLAFSWHCHCYAYDWTFNDTANWHAANMQQIHQTINMWHDLQMSSMQWGCWWFFSFMSHSRLLPCFTKCRHFSIAIVQQYAVYTVQWSKGNDSTRNKNESCEMAILTKCTKHGKQYTSVDGQSSCVFPFLTFCKFALHPMQTIVILFMFWYRFDWIHYQSHSCRKFHIFPCPFNFNNSCWALLSHCSH